MICAALCENLHISQLTGEHFYSFASPFSPDVRTRNGVFCGETKEGRKHHVAVWRKVCRKIFKWKTSADDAADSIGAPCLRVYEIKQNYIYVQFSCYKNIPWMSNSGAILNNFHILSAETSPEWDVLMQKSVNKHEETVSEHEIQ